MVVVPPALRRHAATACSTAGLDPDAVAALVRMAVAEDLMGGIDVTSAATVPADQRSVGTFGSRGHGVVAGLAVAAAAIDAVCGDDGVRRRVPRRRRRPRRARRRRRPRHRADPRAC